MEANMLEARILQGKGFCKEKGDCYEPFGTEKI